MRGGESGRLPSARAESVRARETTGAIRNGAADADWSNPTRHHNVIGGGVAGRWAEPCFPGARHSTTAPTRSATPHEARDYLYLFPAVTMSASPRAPHQRDDYQTGQGWNRRRGDHGHGESADW